MTDSPFKRRQGWLPASTPALRRRQNWLLVAAVLLVAGVGAYLVWGGLSGLDRVRAEITVVDPDWRLPDLIAAHNARVAALPANSADTVQAALKLMPAGWAAPPAADPSSGPAPWDRRPPPAVLAELRAERDRLAPALAVARRLRHQPAGGTPLPVPESAAAFVLDVPQARVVTVALGLDATVAAADGDPAAVASLHAALNAGRSLGDLPTCSAQLSRAACGHVVARAAERVLAVGVPADGLAELQAALLAEAAEPRLRHGLRGERAWFDQVVADVRAGRPPPAGVSHWWVNPFAGTDHARGLRRLHAAVLECDQPAHRRTAGDRLERELKGANPVRYPLTGQLMPTLDRIQRSDALRQADLLTAAVGLACYRHRLAHGRWPHTLADLVPGHLPAVPADPFDGQPLRLRPTADGLAVYSVGPNRVDAGGADPPPTDRTAGDVVFRLYDPARSPPP